MTNSALLTLKTMLQERADLMKTIHSKNEHWKYKGFEELVLECGREMKPIPAPKYIKHGIPKQCYFNCLELIKKHPDLTYVEGYALGDISFPVSHAWLMNPQGKALDPTWESGGLCYIGIPFQTQWVLDFLEARKQRGKTDCLSLFESNYLEEFSFLKGGVPQL
jgi:hypothetical protein